MTTTGASAGARVMKHDPATHGLGRIDLAITRPPLSPRAHVRLEFAHGLSGASVIHRSG